MEKLKALIAQISTLLQTDSILVKIIIAIILLFIGWNIVSILANIIKRTLSKRKFDATLLPFVINLALWAMRALLFITVASYLGVETTSFAAIIGAVSFAIGLALQGALANFAGGVLILLFKPFKVGDYISAGGLDGTVKEISIFTTKLNTFGNQVAIIPNGKLSNDSIINYNNFFVLIFFWLNLPLDSPFNLSSTTFG